MAYARHIKNGRLMSYAVKANQRVEAHLRKGEICAACGRTFSNSLKQSIDPTLCKQCREAL
jgi:formylmethanofuran dehydrogenase subunit E